MLDDLSVNASGRCRQQQHFVSFGTSVLIGECWPRDSALDGKPEALIMFPVNVVSEFAKDLSGSSENVGGGFGSGGTAAADAAVAATVSQQQQLGAVLGQQLPTATAMVPPQHAPAALAMRAFVTAVGRPICARIA